jgi:hypothetical protein
VTGARTIDLLNGSVRHGETSPGGHPAVGMVAYVDHGDGAVSTIIDPTADPHPEWVQRYGKPEGIRFTVASLLASYDYLLSENITHQEAIKRLTLMRHARAAVREAQSPVPYDGNRDHRDRDDGLCR